MEAVVHQMDPADPAISSVHVGALKPDEPSASSPREKKPPEATVDVMDLVTWKVHDFFAFSLAQRSCCFAESFARVSSLIGFRFFFVPGSPAGTVSRTTTEVAGSATFVAGSPAAAGSVGALRISPRRSYAA